MLSHSLGYFTVWQHMTTTSYPDFFLPHARSSVSLPLSEPQCMAHHFLRPRQWFNHTVCASSTGKALRLHHTEAHEYSWFFLPLFSEVPKVYSRGGWQAVNLWQTPADGFPEQKWPGHCSHSCSDLSAICSWVSRASSSPCRKHSPSVTTAELPFPLIPTHQWAAHLDLKMDLYKNLTQWKC